MSAPKHMLCPSCAKTGQLAKSGSACMHCHYSFSTPSEELEKEFRSLLTPKHLASVVEAAMKAAAEARYEQASYLVEFLIENAYGNDQDFRSIGLVFHEAHKDALALICCERAVTVNPQDAANHHAVSACYEEIGVLDKALSHAQEAVRLMPGQSAHHVRLGDIYDKQNQPTLAARSYLTAIAIGNAFDRSFEKILDDAVDIAQLEAHKDELLKVHSNAWAVHQAMGQLYLAKMEFERAESSFRSALALSPHQPVLMNRLAEVYQKENKIDSALDQYKKALALDDRNVETLRALGRLHKDKAQWNDALSYFEQILRLNNKDSNAAYETKEMHRKLNNPHRAIEIMKDYQKADASYFNWAMHHIFEILYYDLKDDQQLCELVEHTYPNKVGESFVYDYYGYSLMNMGRLEEAARSFERFLELESKNARVMRELGRVFCDLGRYQEAIDILNKSFAIEKKNSYGYYYLAYAYHKMGKDDLAKKTLLEGRQFDPNYKWFNDLLAEIDPTLIEQTAATEQETPDTSSTQQTASVLGEAFVPAMPSFLRDLTQMARDGKVDNIFGRLGELQELIEVLCRRTKANPLIVGAPGVGKTVLVNGLAHLLAKGDVPDILKPYRLLELEVFAVVAGTRYVGTLEQKFMQLAQFCRTNKVIIFIDELHTLMGAGSYSSHETGGLDEMFKPLLTQPDFKLIGATTDEEYQKNIAKSGAFERRFTRVTVFEASQGDTLKIMEYQRPKLEEFYHVRISDRALQSILELSDKYIKNRFFPDKACDILERAAIKASLSRTPAGTEAADLVEHHIAQAVSQVTRIPVDNIQIDAMSGMVSLEDRLRMRVIGQEEAITKVAEVIRMTKSGLDINPDRPDGVFLFVGPTGVGKTELAKALAEALGGSEKRLVRIDMSEYNDQYAISKLIGTAPGYVGYEDEGRLTRAIREDPSAVVLLDEIEKAHPKIYEAFLQVFDDGRMTDGKGQTISFSNTTIIMTSNLGAEHIYGKIKVGFTASRTDAHREISDGIKESLRKHFTPEFLNRIDEIVVFRGLDDATLRLIARQKIEAIVRRFATKDIKINVEESVVDLCVAGLDVSREGARGLNRSLEDNISRPLSKVLIQNPDCKVYNITRHEDKVAVMRGV